MQVALKVLHPHLAQEDDVARRFLDEGRVGARIAHPNVVAVHDAGQADGLSYLALEYVHGATLSSLIRAAVANRETVPLPIAASIFLDLLAGLHAAHEVADDDGQSLGIVHRDVSPQNILVDLEGRAFISDFGVARVKDAMRTTRSGTLIGKPGYMAPEQLIGSPVTARTDLYASGILLWECLCGKHLFSGVDDQIQGVVGQRVQPRVRALRPDVPQEIDDLVAQMLEHDPEKRPRNAFDISTRLRQSLTRASRSEVGAWVQKLAGHALSERRTPTPQVESPPPHEVATRIDDDDDEDETTVARLASFLPPDVETLADPNAPELPRPRTLPPVNPPPRSLARVVTAEPDPLEPATLVERPSRTYPDLVVPTPPMVSSEQVRRAMPTVVLPQEPEPAGHHAGYAIAVLVVLGVVGGAWLGLRPAGSADAAPEMRRENAMLPASAESATPELPALAPAAPTPEPKQADAGTGKRSSHPRHR